MTTPHSALWPQTVAIVAAVEGSSSLSALLGTPGIYNTRAPERAPLDYLTLGLATERTDDVFEAFDALGTQGFQQIDIWSRGTGNLGNRKTLAIYDALYGLLNDQPLAIDGFTQIVGRVSLSGIVPDPDGETMHAIVRYDFTYRQIA